MSLPPETCPLINAIIEAIRDADDYHPDGDSIADALSSASPHGSWDGRYYIGVTDRLEAIREANDNLRSECKRLMRVEEELTSRVEQLERQIEKQEEQDNG